jgi:hypothetical protein
MITAETLGSLEVSDGVGERLIEDVAAVPRTSGAQPSEANTLIRPFLAECLPASSQRGLDPTGPVVR